MKYKKRSANSSHVRFSVDGCFRVTLECGVALSAGMELPFQTPVGVVLESEVVLV